MKLRFECLNFFTFFRSPLFNGLFLKILTNKKRIAMKVLLGSQ